MHYTRDNTVSTKIDFQLTCVFQSFCFPPPALSISSLILLFCKMLKELILKTKISYLTEEANNLNA